MSKYLFDVQEKNRLKQKGLLKRFTIDCYGKQSTIEDIRRQKAAFMKAYKEKKSVTQKEYEWKFLKYDPLDSKKKQKKQKKTRGKKNKKRKRTRKRKKVMGIF